METKSIPLVLCAIPRAYQRTVREANSGNSYFLGKIKDRYKKECEQGKEYYLSSIGKGPGTTLRKGKHKRIR